MIALLGLVIGVVALTVALSREAKAAPPEEYVPTAEEIAASKSLAELDAYYDLISELYIRGVIDKDTYWALYQVYEARYYELLGES